MMGHLDSSRLEGGHPGSGKTGKARTGELDRVMNEMRKRQRQGAGAGNEWARFYTKVVGQEILTEGGIKQQVSARRKAEHAQVGESGEVGKEWGHQIHPLLDKGKLAS